MFWHDHISINAHREAAAHVLQTLHKQVVSVRGAKGGLPSITTESNEVGLSGLLPRGGL
jgi:hypothetical protein